MSPREAPKIQRWIDLLAALLARRYPVTFEQLTHDVPGYGGADTEKARASLMRKFERDKDDLRSFGIPIETVRSSEGEAQGYRLRGNDFYLPYLAAAAGTGSETGRRARNARAATEGGYSPSAPLTFEPDELAAIAASGARICMLGDPLLAGDAASALRKLAFYLPLDVAAAGSAEHVVPARETIDPKTFAALGRALVDRKRVRFEYYAISNDTTSPRETEPYGLFFLNGHWYLVGRDLVKDELRNFRLDRMRGITVNREQAQTPDYTIPATFHLREHARSRQSWELGSDDGIDAIVEFRGTSGAAAAAMRLGEPVADEPARRRFSVRRPDVFARWLLSLAGDAVPVAPEALVDRFRAIARETLAVYAPAMAGPSAQESGAGAMT